MSQDSFSEGEQERIAQRIMCKLHLFQMRIMIIQSKNQMTSKKNLYNMMNQMMNINNRINIIKKKTNQMKEKMISNPNTNFKDSLKVRKFKKKSK
jgi:hypothetical protein